MLIGVYNTVTKEMEPYSPAADTHHHTHIIIFFMPTNLHSTHLAYHTHLPIFLTYHTHHHCPRRPRHTRSHSPAGRLGRVHAWCYFHSAWRGVPWFGASSHHNSLQKRIRCYLSCYRSWGFNIGRRKSGVKAEMDYSTLVFPPDYPSEADKPRAWQVSKWLKAPVFHGWWQ